MFIGIFCSANANIPDLYFEETKRLGRWIGENGHSLVWGGCSLGLMETVGRSFLEGRSLGTDGSEGSLIGVVPSIIEERGKVFSPMDRTIRCSNLSQRKDLIVENSDEGLYNGLKRCCDEPALLKEYREKAKLRHDFFDEDRILKQITGLL